MSTHITVPQLLKLSREKRLFGTVFATLGGHNGKGYWGHGDGVPATVEKCAAGLAVYLNDAFKCVIYEETPIILDDKLISWGSSITLHIDKAPCTSWQRAPL